MGKHIKNGIFLIFLIILSFAYSCSKNETASEIRIGGIFDLTGATHEICVPYADGIRKYIDYVNEKGGINGRKVRLIEADYGYLLPKSKEIYDKLVKKDKVHAILGWGTGDTEHLVPYVTRDKVPFMSGAYSQKLGIIDKAPYNFLIGVTYSDQMRIALRYILESWKDKSSKPKVAFIYNETEFGISPIHSGREYVKMHGIELVAEEIVSLDAREARAQLLRIKAKNADFVIIQETTWATSVILKDAKQLGIKTKFIGLNWCVDEKLIALAGEAAEGFMGVIPFVFTDSNLPGIQRILDYTRRKNIKIEGYMLRFIQGWVTAEVMLEGVKRAGNKISGTGIKKGLESISDYSTGGITAPITFSPSNHIGCNKLKIGKVVNTSWQLITDYLSGS